METAGDKVYIAEGSRCQFFWSNLNTAKLQVFHTLHTTLERDQIISLVMPGELLFLILLLIFYRRLMIFWHPLILVRVFCPYI